MQKLQHGKAARRDWPGHKSIPERGKDELILQNVTCSSKAPLDANRKSESGCRNGKFVDSDSPPLQDEIGTERSSMWETLGNEQDCCCCKAFMNLVCIESLETNCSIHQMRASYVSCVLRLQPKAGDSMSSDIKTVSMTTAIPSLPSVTVDASSLEDEDQMPRSQVTAIVVVCISSFFLMVLIVSMAYHIAFSSLVIEADLRRALSLSSCTHGTSQALSWDAAYLVSGARKPATNRLPPSI